MHLSDSCSHNRAVILYAESIAAPFNFPAIPCSMHAIRMRSTNLCGQKIKENGLTKVAIADAIAEKNEQVIAYMGENVGRR